MKSHLVILLLLFIIGGNDVRANGFPAELAYILLQERPIQDGVRYKNWVQVHHATDAILISWHTLSTKLIKIPSDTKKNIKQSIVDLIKASDEENAVHVNKTFIELQKQLYSLYARYGGSISPELNFIMIDLDQLDAYIDKMKFDWILDEIDELSQFISIIKNRFEGKGLLEGKVKLLFKYFEIVMKKTIPACYDRDIETVHDNIQTLHRLVEIFSKIYRTEKNVEIY